MTPEIMLKPTVKERHIIRGRLLDDTAREHVAVHVWDNGDGTYAADVSGIILEGPTVAELLREIASVLEEA